MVRSLRYITVDIAGMLQICMFDRNDKEILIRFNFYIFALCCNRPVLRHRCERITYDLRKSRGQRPADTRNPPNIRERASWKDINVHFGRLNKSYHRVSPNEALRSILVPRSVAVVVVCRSCRLPEAVSFYLLCSPPCPFSSTILRFVLFFLCERCSIYKRGRKGERERERKREE